MNASDRTLALPIRVKTPLVEIDGDEMTRILWAWVKDRLLFPFLDLPIEYFDLGIEHRDETGDRVTHEAARAIRTHGVGVKCATITPNAERVREYGLKQEWKSPNATLRAALDGTVFRAPILAENIPPGVRSWEKAIHIGRHAYGDVYSNTEMRIPGPGTVELVYRDAEGREQQRAQVHTFAGPGIVQGIHNTDASISAFAETCFRYAHDRHIDLWFGAKDTISKTYDARFRDAFLEAYAAGWKDKFAARGVEFRYMLIDDAVAQIMKSRGGMLWACKNYDGDVMSDMVASAYGSLAMMTSVLLSPDGHWKFEAAHGTVQRHYYRHRDGESTSTNSMALIFAWTGALKKRGEIDQTPDVIRFAEILERAALDTIESGTMTGDLVRVARPGTAKEPVSSEAFIDAVRRRVESRIQAG